MDHFHGSLGLHGCEDIIITQRMPENANSISLAIIGPDRQTFEVTLYNLPTYVTERLEVALNAPQCLESGAPEPSR